MDINEALKIVGLNDKQSAVYTALLQLGRTSAYAAAIKSGLKKPTVYVVLEELIKKGVARQIPRKGKRLYMPRPPEEIFAVAEEQFALAKTALPEMQSLTKSVKEKVQSLYYEGESGMRQAIYYRHKEMRGKEFVGFYAKVPPGVKKLELLFFEWAEDCRRKHITMRGVAPDDPSLAEYRAADLKFGRQMKIISKERYASNISIDVGDIFVRVMSYGDLQATIIENPEVAETMRQIFEMIWRDL
jgi:sugar-specific transcriptional regulator TrmB